MFAGNLMVFYAEGVTRTLTFVASWTALAGLLASLFGIFLRGALWLRLSRVALYVVAMVFGIQLLGTLPQILDADVAPSALGLLAAVVYLIGARGYLNSSNARRYFGVEDAADETSAPAD
jgi:predicted membrane channel-forming protein YqfA (hemolysin III family)